MPKNKQYKIDVPVDGENESVTYEVSGTGEITVKKVGSEDGSDLSPAEKAKIVKAIKAAPHPGNELPEGEGAVDPGYGKPAGGRPDQGLPGSGARPDQDLPGSGGRPNQDLPGSGGRPNQDLPQQGANPNLDPNLDPDVGRGNRPDQSLPGGRPDQSLPGSQPGVDNTLPPGSETPDQELPETPEPK